MMIPNPAIHQTTEQVLATLARVEQLFGGDVDPVAPAPFAADRELETGLGRGRF